MRLADQARANGAKKLHLMLSTIGGDVFWGVHVSRYLSQIGLRVSTYNLSAVQSIGVTLFCAGSERYCSPEATFAIHPVTRNVPAQVAFSAKQFREAADACDADGKSIATIISIATGQTVETVFKDMEGTRFFNAEDSLDYGLVTKVIPNVSLENVGYTVIEEDGSFRDIGMTPIVRPLSPNLASALSKIGLPNAPIYKPPTTA